MKTDTGKRFFIALLTLCFCLITMLSIYDPEYALTGVEETRLENPTLFVEERADGVLYIGGKGKLTRNDIDELLLARDRALDDFAHVIVGDGITEIAYQCFQAASGLETLWLGSGVEVIANVAIKKCNDLRYIFLPSGLRRIGRDAFYACPNVIVVTDGALDQLPRLRNVGEDRVLQHVDSYQAFEAALAAMNDGLPQGGEAEDAADATIPKALLQWWK